MGHAGKWGKERSRLIWSSVRLYEIANEAVYYIRLQSPWDTHGHADTSTVDANAEGLSGT